MGALLGHITGGADAATFQPMNVNFGLFPPIDGNFARQERKQALSARALREFDALARADAAGGGNSYLTRHVWAARLAPRSQH